MLRKATKNIHIAVNARVKAGDIRSTQQGDFTVRNVGTELEGFTVTITIQVGHPADIICLLPRNL